MFRVNSWRTRAALPSLIVPPKNAFG